MALRLDPVRVSDCLKEVKINRNWVAVQLKCRKLPPSAGGGTPPSRTHPLWPAKLAMRGFAADYPLLIYLTEHPHYENPGYAPGELSNINGGPGVVCMRAIMADINATAFIVIYTET